jgi:hypothetical protein
MSGSRMHGERPPATATHEVVASTFQLGTILMTRAQAFDCRARAPQSLRMPLRGTSCDNFTARRTNTACGLELHKRHVCTDYGTASMRLAPASVTGYSNRFWCCAPALSWWSHGFSGLIPPCNRFTTVLRTVAVCYPSEWNWYPPVLTPLTRQGFAGFKAITVGRQTAAERRSRDNGGNVTHFLLLRFFLQKNTKNDEPLNVMSYTGF